MENSNIEWTDHTFNPWIGCEKVSAACKFCYAEKLDSRFTGGVNWGKGAARTRTSEKNWLKPLHWNHDAEQKGIRYRVFCASMADVFEDRPDLITHRHDLFDLIERTPHLDWLLLTKRPENIFRLTRPFITRPESLKNVLFGATVENQDEFDKRIPHLLESKALLKPKAIFLSMEPLLGYINLTPVLSNEIKIDWIIVGGESGQLTKIRRIDLSAVKLIKGHCENNGIAFFFKQLGTKLAAEYKLPNTKGGHFDDYPPHFEWLKLRQFPNV